MGRLPVHMQALANCVCVGGGGGGGEPWALETVDLIFFKFDSLQGWSAVLLLLLTIGGVWSEVRSGMRSEESDQE